MTAASVATNTRGIERFVMSSSLENATAAFRLSCSNSERARDSLASGRPIASRERLRVSGERVVAEAREDHTGQTGVLAGERSHLAHDNRNRGIERIAVAAAAECPKS